jgi:uncharacterized membrane protein
MHQTLIRPIGSVTQKPHLQALPQTTERYGSIDIARGIAVFLMILSHGIVGLVPFDKLEGFALIPIHLVTKFSSSLFILIFGVSLALFYAPHASTPDWPRRRTKLILKGFEILVWYKILTFIQMFQTYDRTAILDAMFFLRFPDFVEVLGFYGIFLLWFPFLLPRWVKMPILSQLVTIAAVYFTGSFLSQVLDFGSWTPLKAILFEHDGFFTFGQFQRGALVLLGMFMGAALISKHETKYRYHIAAAGVIGLGVFYLTSANLEVSLLNIASNIGKHPPTLEFMSFSLGGALLLFSTTLFLKSKVPVLLDGFAVLGRNPLQAFVFHIFVIFVFYRFLLDLKHQVTYPAAVGFTILLLMGTVAWVSGLEFKNKWSKPLSAPKGAPL